jgi:hypothetical protein
METPGADAIRKWSAQLQDRFSMVGEYLWNFALLEGALDELIINMMGIYDINGHILTANIDVVKK